MGDERSPSHERSTADGDRKRLDDLDSRLRAAREGAEPPRPKTAQRETSFAYRVLADLIAGLGFGAFVGWWLDNWLGTKPILLMAMILVGFVAGAWSADRASQAYTAGLDKRDDE